MFLDNYKDPLRSALEKGLVSEEELDGAIRGTIRVWLRLGKLDDSGENPYTWIGITDTLEPWLKPEAMELAREATRKSVVLLKNEGALLPLDPSGIKSIAVIGPASDLVVSDWYSGTPPYRVSVLDGIHNALEDIRNARGEKVEILHCNSNMADSAVIAAGKADVALVCVGNHPLSHGLGWAENLVASEGREAVDRQAISMEQEDLVRLVRKANPNTVMVLVSSFPYAINWSKEHVPAILHITQSSQELGNGLADVIFGKESPAGKLVQTWSRSIDELPPILDYNILNGRTYMYDPHEALFPFGFGLTYTTFDFTDLEVPRGALKEGEKAEIRFRLNNSGPVDSDQVVQLYVSFPESEVERPPIALKAFKRVHVAAGEGMEVQLPLDTDELRYWDVKQHAFVLEKGKVEFFIGTSSNDRRLEGSLSIR